MGERDREQGKSNASVIKVTAVEGGGLVLPGTPEKITECISEIFIQKEGCWSFYPQGSCPFVEGCAHGLLYA